MNEGMKCMNRVWRFLAAAMTLCMLATGSESALAQVKVLTSRRAAA